jgi:O-methyltransferase domain/Dimerisation domain
MSDAGNGPVTPDTIQRLQAGVAPALAMLAGMQLGVFTQLADAPLTGGEIAARLGVLEDRLSRLLYALVVSGMLEVVDDRFANTPETAAFLVAGRPGYLGATHELWSQLWRADLGTAESIRSGRPIAPHDFTKISDAEMSAMLRGMHAGTVAAAQDLIRRFDFSGYRSVIDVGGGSGGLAAGLCDAFPALQATLFDLPGTATLAEPVLRASPGGDRVSIEAGDILAEPPTGLYDAAIVRALIQVLSAEDARRALINASAAVRPGGHVYLLGGGILDNDRVGPRPAVFWSVTFMNIYAAGASYTEAEHAAWLAEAGCGDIHRITLPSGGGIIRATKRG